MMKRQAGFTLLELMVAMSITAMVLLAVAAAFSGWVRTEERAGFTIDQTRRQEFELTRLRTVLSTIYIPFVPGREGLARFEGDAENMGP